MANGIGSPVEPGSFGCFTLARRATVGRLEIDRLAGVPPTDLDVGIVFVNRGGNRIVARRGEVLEPGCINAQRVATIRVAAVRSMADIRGDRETIPVAGEVA